MQTKAGVGVVAVFILESITMITVSVLCSNKVHLLDEPLWFPDRSSWPEAWSTVLYVLDWTWNNL